MKFSNFEAVCLLVQDRRSLIGQREGASTEALTVRIQVSGAVQYLTGSGTVSHADPDMTLAIRQGVLGEIDRRLSVNAQALLDLGVEVT